MEDSKFINSRLAKSVRIDFQLTLEDVEEILKKHQDFYYAISTFEFNIFEFSKTVGRNMQMPVLASTIMDLNGLSKIINQKKFLQFIIQIYNKYHRAVEYHNDLHGSDVA